MIQYHEVNFGIEWRKLALQYRVAIARLYEQVRCRLKTDNDFSEHFFSNMGVNQGCPLSPIFGLCIDKLEEVVNRVAIEEGLDAPKLMHGMRLRRFKICFEGDNWELNPPPPIKLCSWKQVFDL